MTKHNYFPTENIKRFDGLTVVLGTRPLNKATHYAANIYPIGEVNPTDVQRILITEWWEVNNRLCAIYLENGKYTVGHAFAYSGNRLELSILTTPNTLAEARSAMLTATSAEAWPDNDKHAHCV